MIRQGTFEEHASKQFHDLLLNFRGHLPELLTAIIGFSVTMAGFPALLGIPAPWWRWSLLGLAGAALAIRVLGGFTFFKPTYAHLKVELSEAHTESKTAQGALQEALDALLRHLLMYVCDKDANVRASLYTEEAGEFVLQSRRSSNPALQKRGRKSYPVGPGAISEAWQEGSVYLFDLPRTRRRWERSLEAQGVSREDAESIQMQSLSLVGLRIEALDKNIGVLIFESLKPDGLTWDHLDKARDSKLLEVIRELMYASHSRFPHAHQHHLNVKRETAERERSGLMPKWKTVGRAETAVNL